MKILLVDDDADWLRVGSAFLGKLGHQCTLASNGKEGVELYGQFEPDAVLMDIDMPVMDGVSAVAAILSEDPQARVAFVSNRDEFPEGTPREIAEQLKINRKPATVDEMRSILNSVKPQPADRGIG